MASTTGQSQAQAERARVAVAVVFIAVGVFVASWFSRLPAIQDALHLDPAQLGLLLLCMSVGSMVTLPLSGPAVQRFGSAAAVVGGHAGMLAGVLLTAAGIASGSVPLVVPGMLLTGFGVGMGEVSMNVEAAQVEHRVGRVLMPRFHAGFSIGSVAGALLGAAAAALDVPVAWQIVVVQVAVFTVAVAAVRSFLPVDHSARDGSRKGTVKRSWLERRTLLIGLLVLAFAAIEGSANDWLAIAFTDGHGTSEAVGAAGLALFVAAMTGFRIIGGGLLDKFGRPVVLRVSALAAACGLLLVVFASPLPLVLIGTLLWGAGAALGFPVGMSAAADQPSQAAARVSVVSSIGYTAFLMGPPLIGFAARNEGILHGLLIMMAMCALALLTAGASRPETS